MGCSKLDEEETSLQKKSNGKDNQNYCFGNKRLFCFVEIIEEQVLNSLSQRMQKRQ